MQGWTQSVSWVRVAAARAVLVRCGLPCQALDVTARQALRRCCVDQSYASQVLESGVGLQLSIRFRVVVQESTPGSEQVVPYSSATVCLAVDDGTRPIPVLNREF